MTTILVLLLIYTGADQPVKGAWVEVAGMVHSPYIVEQVTDSHGVFVVEVDVEPSLRTVRVGKVGYQPFAGDLAFVADGVIGIRLDPATPSP